MNVAIVGTGISGVTLALRLQQLGVASTLLAERTPGEMRTGQLENLVARFPATQQRERELEVAHWDAVDGYASHGIEVAVAGTPLGFRGHLELPARAVDFRVYLSRLVEDFVARGGSIVFGALPRTVGELEARTAGHEVVVVAVGRSAPVGAQLFPVRSDRSPYSAPQRHLIGGLFTGVAQSESPVVSFNIVPGGEIFQQAFLTDRGVVSSMLVEAQPGGPLDPVARFDLSRGRDAFASALLDAVGRHAPALAARIDASQFGVLGPRDLIQGAITPVVRRGWSQLPSGRLALALGDAWIANDPITGQGANIGSYCAWRMADVLATGDPGAPGFGSWLEDELWRFAGPVTAWTNGFLQPPPAHVLDLLEMASAHQPVADAFAAGFADPVRFATQLADPAGVESLIAGALARVPA